MSRRWCVVALAACSWPAWAQVGAENPALASGPAPVAAASVALPVRPPSLTPVDCKAASAGYPQPWLQQICEQSNYDLSSVYAKAYGMPLPSRRVISLPAYGSAASKRHGVACLGQLAMSRVANGWEQLRDAEGRYQRCRDQ